MSLQEYVDWPWHSRNTTTMVVSGAIMTAIVHVCVSVLAPRFWRRPTIFNGFTLASAICFFAKHVTWYTYFSLFASWVFPTQEMKEAWDRGEDPWANTRTLDNIMFVFKDVALPCRVIAQLLRVKAVMVSPTHQRWINLPLAICFTFMLARISIIPLTMFEYENYMATFIFIFTQMLVLTAIAVWADSFAIMKFVKTRKKVLRSRVYVAPRRRNYKGYQNIPSVSTSATPDRRHVFSERRMLAILCAQIVAEMVHAVQFVLEAIDLWIVKFKTDPILIDEAMGDIAFLFGIYGITLLNDQISKLSSCRELPKSIP